MDNVCGVVAATSLVYPDMFAHVERIVRRFECLNGMSVFVIREQDLVGQPLVMPHFARYYAWRLVPENVERIVYFDTDIIPVWPLPELPTEAFSAVEEKGEAQKKSIPLIKRVNSYFNSGFFVADRRTEPVFDRILARQSTATEGKPPLFWDQTLANIEIHTAVIMEKLSYRVLSEDWCHASWKLPLTEQKSPCMVHFLGNPPMKVRMIGRFVEVLDKTL